MKRIKVLSHMDELLQHLRSRNLFDERSYSFGEETRIKLLRNATLPYIDDKLFAIMKPATTKMFNYEESRKRHFNRLSLSANPYLLKREGFQKRFDTYKEENDDYRKINFTKSPEPNVAKMLDEILESPSKKFDLNFKFPNLNDWFKNQNALTKIDLHCKAGQFVIPAALENPNVNYIALTNVFNDAIKLVGLVRDIPNVKVFLGDIAGLISTSLPPNSLDEVYFHILPELSKKYNFGVVFNVNILSTLLRCMKSKAKLNIAAVDPQFLNDCDSLVKQIPVLEPLSSSSLCTTTIPDYITPECKYSWLTSQSTPVYFSSWIVQ